MGRLGLGLIGCLAVLVLIIIIGGVWYIGARNNFVTLDENVNQQWAQVQSQYQRRYDLIPNLVRTVQGAANFEKSTLEAVVNARARVGQVQVGNGPGGGSAPGATSREGFAARIVARVARACARVSRRALFSEGCRVRPQVYFTAIHISL